MLNFFLYFFLSLVMLGLAISIYAYVTPYDEVTSAMSGKMAPTVSLVGAMLGMAIPLASLVAHSVSILDLAMWGLVVLLVQLLTWFVATRFVFRWLVKAVIDNNVAAATLLATINVCVGLCNAASVTY